MKDIFNSDNKISITSSKGNQEKWFSNDRWYKLDQFGYEGLAEVVVSRMLERSNIKQSTPFTFVSYRLENMFRHGIERVGCSSGNFLSQEQRIITLAHLFKSNGISLSDTLMRLPSDKQRLRFLAEETSALTGLKSFPEYLTLLIETDALFLNNDRHLNNIAVLRENNKYQYCPIFDNGAALLSNTMDYPMNIDPKAFIPTVKARPLNTTFNRQVKHMNDLYGKQLDICRFSKNDIREILEDLLPFYPQRDRGLIADRVICTIMTRQRYR